MTSKPCCICDEVHQRANQFARCCFPFDPSKIPNNGIYLLFEKGERAHGADRIVRIGTHTGQGNLPGRLFEHFLTPNKDRSIFRKNIGRALLARSNDPFSQQWDLDMTTVKARKQYGRSIDRDKLVAVEEEVSKYIREHFTFAVLPVATKEQRLLLESGLIAAIAQCPNCSASTKWLGRYSPKPQIRKSGLWQVQHLKGKPLQLIHEPRSYSAIHASR